MSAGVDPARTLAVVVGVERYDVGPDWNLDGPASDALRFTRWLLERGVPAENVRLLLAPLPANEGLAAEPGLPEVVDATTAAVEAALDDWLGARAEHGDADLLFLFWGGHGVMADDESRHLFCRDVTRFRVHGIDLAFRLRKLRSAPWSRIWRQVAIVDACANYFDGVRLARTIDGAGRADPDVRQTVLLAAAAGEQTGNDTVRKMGDFSRVVLEALGEAPAGVFPPDPVALHHRVHAHFVERSGSPHAGSHPVLYEWKIGGGSSGVEGELPAWASVQRSARVRGASLEQYRTVVARMLRAPALRDGGARARLLRALPPAVRERIAAPTEEDPAAFLLEVVAETLREDGGGARLVDALRQVPVGTVADQVQDAVDSLAVVAGLLPLLWELPLGVGELRALYLASAADPQRAEGALSPAAMLSSLWEMAAGPEGESRLTEFMERVARRTGHPEPARWVEQQVPAATLRELRARLDREEAGGRRALHLLVDVPFPFPSRLEYWVYAGNQVQRHGTVPCAPTLDGVGSALVELVARLDGEADDVVVELFLPHELMGWEAERLEWMMDPHVRPALGLVHPVLVRWRDRAQRHPGARAHEWRRLARTIRGDAVASRPLKAYWPKSDTDSGVLLGRLRGGSFGACVGFSYMAAEASAGAGPLLRAALLAGVPFAVWPRRAPADPAGFRRGVEAGLLGGALDRVPFLARDVRLGDVGSGDGLAVLWDDPERNPLDLPLETPQPGE